MYYDLGVIGMLAGERTLVAVYPISRCEKAPSDTGLWVFMVQRVLGWRCCLESLSDHFSAKTRSVLVYLASYAVV